MENKAFYLLKRWCDKLIGLQLPDTFGPELAGGIMCPACHRIHGRCADVLPAFSLLYGKTGDKRYYDAAKRVFRWSERTLRRKDGSMYNDSNQSWKCIAVFAAIALGETITKYGDILEPSFTEELKESLQAKAEYVASESFLSSRPVINYPVSSAAALRYAGMILNRPDFCREAERRYRTVMENNITPDNFLFGEGHTPTAKTERGCCAVDMGYNMEESYSNLAIYATLCKDREKQERVASLFRASLGFLLPDGGLDNSFGCRSDKWTYYGSRTSDGMAVGLSLLSGFDPTFAEAAWRNFSMMEKCTTDDLLSGGFQYGEAKEPPCAHHSITHSKALAALCEAGDYTLNTVALPIETEAERYSGISRFDSLGIYRVSYGSWIASACFGDCQLPPEKLPGSGGVLTLLYHRALGVISASSMTRYYLSEPNNMQLSRHQDEIGYTAPRIEAGGFSSAYERCAEAKAGRDEKSCELSFAGHMRDIRGKEGDKFSISYRFSENSLKITLLCGGEADFLFNAVSDAAAPERISEDRIRFGKSGDSYSVAASSVIECAGERTWTPCGGFMSFPLRLHLTAGKEETFEIFYGTAL